MFAILYLTKLIHQFQIGPVSKKWENILFLRMLKCLIYSASQHTYQSQPTFVFEYLILLCPRVPRIRGKFTIIEKALKVKIEPAGWLWIYHFSTGLYNGRKPSSFSYTIKLIDVWMVAGNDTIRGGRRYIY